MLLAVVAEPAGADEPLLGLAYAQPGLDEQCPDPRTFQGKVTALLGRDPFGEPAVQLIRVNVRREAAGLVGSVALVSQSGLELGHRQLAPSISACSEVISALAMAAVLALDPLAVVADPAAIRALSPSFPPPATPVPIEPSRTSPSEDAAAETDPAAALQAKPRKRITFTTGLFAGPNLGLGPGLLWSLGPEVGVGLGPWRLEGALAWSDGFDATIAYSAVVDVSTVQADLAAVRSVGALELALTLAGRRERIATHRMGETNASVHWSAAPGLRVGWIAEVREGLSVVARLDASAEFGLRRLVEAPFGEVLWSRPPVCAGFTVGLRLEWR